MKKRYWYAVRKSYGNLRIYYKLEIMEGISQFYLTDTLEKGNKKVELSGKFWMVGDDGFSD
jgi:hypothetical protein